MGITVNGISLTEIQKNRNMNNKNTVNNKKNTASNKKKNELAPAPSLNKKGDMMKYVTSQKKKIDNYEQTHIQTMNNSEDNNTKKNNKNDNMKNKITVPLNKNTIEKKLTFEPTVEQGVAQKINNFRRLSEITKCVIGIGYCSGHNVKLERKVKMKKMSYIEKDGNIGWRLREVTSIECPAKNPGIPVYSAKPMMSSNPESEGTNGKRRKFDVKSMDQPQLTRTSQKMKDDILLDVTR